MIISETKYAHLTDDWQGRWRQTTLFAEPDLLSTKQHPAEHPNEQSLFMMRFRLGVVKRKKKHSGRKWKKPLQNQTVSA